MSLPVDRPLRPIACRSRGDLRNFYNIDYYERIWLKCHKIQGTARTLYNGQDAFGAKHKTKMKIVRHSPGQNIGGKVLFWGTTGKLSVMSTRWHWTAGCSICAKPRRFATGKAQSPMVEWHVDGMTSIDVHMMNIVASFIEILPLSPDIASSEIGV